MIQTSIPFRGGGRGRGVVEILLVASVAEPGIVCIMSGSMNTLA